jgi:hypothetical protein
MRVGCVGDTRARHQLVGGTDRERFLLFAIRRRVHDDHHYRPDRLHGHDDAAIHYLHERHHSGFYGNDQEYDRLQGTVTRENGARRKHFCRGRLFAKMCKLRVAAALVAALLGCQPLHACESSVFVEGSRVGLFGCISEASVSKAIAAFPSNASELIIQSHGGDVGAALTLANEISRRRVSVRIRGFCDSSCANYLVPAGASAVVEAGSRVSFHGDARLSLRSYKDEGAPDRHVLAALEQLSAREEAFGEVHPRAALIHELQSVVLGNGPISLPRGMKCEGLGHTLWVPSSASLLRMNLIDEIVQFQFDAMSEIPFEFPIEIVGKVSRSPDPLANCTR